MFGNTIRYFFRNVAGNFFLLFFFNGVWFLVHAALPYLLRETFPVARFLTDPFGLLPPSPCDDCGIPQRLLSFLEQAKISFAAGAVVFFSPLSRAIFRLNMEISVGRPSGLRLSLIHI